MEKYRVENRKVKGFEFRGFGSKLPVLAGSAMALAIAALSGCAPKPAPPPPPPPPPIAIVIPPKPIPPMGAPVDMTIPPVDASGNRQTVNSGISSSQAVWNLRSAYNVAALNCVEPEYAPILAGYKRFLKVYAKQLATANKDVGASFSTQHSGRAAIVARESYQTQVYNFFALPPVDSGFCGAAMDLTTALEAVTPDQFNAYAFIGLAKMEAPFKSFFDQYDAYKKNLAAWQSSYGGGDITVRPTFDQQVQAQSAVVQSAKPLSTTP